MLRIRQAESTEATSIASLINAAFVIEHRFKNGDRTSPPEISGMMQKGHFLVALQGDRLVGTVYVQITGKTGYIGTLAVDPTEQRSGIGRTLREASEAFCVERDCNKMTLRVIDLREELPPYYEKFGYRITGTEPVPDGVPFTQPVHFIWMAKPL